LCLLKASTLKQFDNQLSAALSLIDLKYEEANDTINIIDFLSNNKIDLVLKRIESYGGIDEDAIERKFILYMVCLIELTFLKSKLKPFQKNAINQLINHLDQHLPLDVSILSWGKFFPSHLIYQLIYEWKNSNLNTNYKAILNRTREFKLDWLGENLNCNEIERELIIELKQLYKNENKYDFELSKKSKQIPESKN